MKRLAVSLSIILIALAAAFVAQAQPKPLTINDLLKIRRAGDPQLSPDGRWVAYIISDLNMEANRRVTQIYLISVDGGEARQLTNAPQSSSGPRWSPDGKKLAFVSAREGGPQVWTIDIATNEQKRVTNISTGAGDPVWSPDGRLIAFVSDIYPECTTDDCNRKREEQAESSKVKAKISDRLLFRHWSTWKEGKRTHVFIASVDGGQALDVTPGDYDAPPFSLGGPPDYAFSPDSKELVFARNTEKVEATSTNGDLFIVPVTGGEAKRITEKNLAADLSPIYSPDSRFIAYRAQARAGFESDRWQLMLYDRKSGQTRSLTDKLDTSVESITFTSDGQRIYFTGTERGKQLIYSVPTAGGAIAKLVTDGFNDDVKVSNDGKTIIFSRSTSVLPTEIFRASADGSNVVQLTKTNESFLAPFTMKAAEEVTWEGAGGTKISGYIIKPANFNPSKKYPMIVLIHGGPQGAWNENWGYRWNPQAFASQGYVVFMPNPRGSTGYGQQFVDEISGDWGGKAFTDIMNGVAHVLGLGYVDKERLGAAGGSYGGYMVNWIEGHNDDPRFQFKVLVSHAGVYNLTSMYGATEELWFTDWEFKGTPWDNPEMYTRWSPHMFVKNFKTPLLVVHGELDYRVPIGEGLQLFTALQRRGVDSKLLYFPDEGHWILKPHNSVLWYNTVLDWFGKYLRPTS